MPQCTRDRRHVPCLATRHPQGLDLSHVHSSGYNIHHAAVDAELLPGERVPRHLVQPDKRRWRVTPSVRRETDHNDPACPEPFGQATCEGP